MINVIVVTALHVLTIWALLIHAKWRRASGQAGRAGSQEGTLRVAITAANDRGGLGHREQ